MNSQNLPDDLCALAQEVFKTMGIEAHRHSMSYWAWPQTFGSTAGPFGGMGGSAITTFTMEAITVGPIRDIGGGPAVIFCNGRVVAKTMSFELKFKKEERFLYDGKSKE